MSIIAGHKILIAASDKIISSIDIFSLPRGNVAH